MRKFGDGDKKMNKNERRASRQFFFEEENMKGRATRVHLRR